MKRAVLLAAALAAALPAAPALARPGDRYERHHGGWSRGQVLPRQYRSRTYIVSDYGHYRLRAPPRGYRYVRYGDDVLLTAIASGVIAAVLADAIDGGYRGSYYEEEVSYGPRGRPYRDGYDSGYSGGGSRVIQGPGGQTIIQEGPNGRTITRQGPGGQTITHEGPDGASYVRQGPGGQVIDSTPGY